MVTSDIFAFVGVEGFVGVVTSRGLQNGFVNFAGVGVGAPWGGEGIDDKVNLTAHLVFDDVNGLFFELMGEGVTIERLGKQAFSGGGFFECRGIVPASGASALLTARFLEKDSQGIGT